jgi:hypothetical protein
LCKEKRAALSQFFGTFRCISSSLSPLVRSKRQDLMTLQFLFK